MRHEITLTSTHPHALTHMHAPSHAPTHANHAHTHCMHARTPSARTHAHTVGDRFNDRAAVPERNDSAARVELDGAEKNKKGHYEDNFSVTLNFEVVLRRLALHCIERRRRGYSGYSRVLGTPGLRVPTHHGLPWATWGTTGYLGYPWLVG
jgi:hypothetical protein